MLTKKQTMNNLSLVFNKKISILKFCEVENEIGDYEQKLNEIKTLYSFITSISKGREFLDNKKLEQRLIYKVIIRYIEGLDQSMFIRYKDKIFNIKDILGKDLNGPYITLICEEKSSENE